MCWGRCNLSPQVHPGGVDGLRPQHLSDMIDRSSPGSLGKTLVEFTNMVLAGGVPEEVRPVFSEVDCTL